MLSILKKEINSFLNSLIAYMAIIVFLIAIGLFMWVFPATSILEYGFADMETLFSMAPYIFMFLIPAITMRSFAEEKKTGTIEFLLTKPLTDTQIIIGKYLATVFLVLISILPTLIYYFSVYLLGNPVGNIDTAGVIGSYIGLFLLGSVFCSIGVFSSSITDNQILSFIIATFLCFLIYEGFSYISTINVWSNFSYYIEQLGISYHYASISKGLIDSKTLLYFFSVIFIMLSATKLVLGSRKW
ncbi:MAG TPA: gliding motility-associated ABC transporter permease subunit GldF [Cytophagales bacterium]|nr:gliding motility-associated ABC transporter permease subunit GldF [Cytophagales bacterium]